MLRLLSLCGAAAVVLTLTGCKNSRDCIDDDVSAAPVPAAPAVVERPAPPAAPVRISSDAPLVAAVVHTPIRSTRTNTYRFEIGERSLDE